MMLESYKGLAVWQKAMDLVEEVYELTGQLPEHEKYNLANHMRKSAISIPSNIAEGYKRSSTTDYRRFINIAQASGSELETQALAVNRLYADCDCSKALDLISEAQKMLFSLHKKLDNQSSSKA